MTNSQQCEEYDLPRNKQRYFRGMDIVVPVKNPIVEFANIASGILQQVRHLNRSTIRLTQARDLLLPQLMSGELVT